jgi:hypothetical protein
MAADRVAHHPPGVHALDALRAEPFQPGQLGVDAVGVDVQVDPQVNMNK